MSIKKDPTQKQLKQIFEYKDGKLIRKRLGTNALVHDSGNGECQVRSRVYFNGKNHHGQRLVYIINNGAIPKNHDIDHINGNKLDNRIENLRACTRSQNLMNAKLSKANTSGYKNVSERADGTFIVRITVKGEMYKQTGFKTAAAANTHARKMRVKLAGEYARHK